MNNQCIESWKKFSSYIPLSSLVKGSIELMVDSLAENAKVADFGGGNPLNPQSSSYLLNNFLEKKLKNYSFDVYDINGEQPRNEKIRFIKGPLQETIDLSKGYDFAISINALQTPSVPFNISKKIYESMKPESQLLMLLPKKRMDEPELFQEIESIIKEYPKGVVERRYSLSSLKNYFPKKCWNISNINEIPFSMPLEKKSLDYYFMNPLIKEKAFDFVKNFAPANEENKYMKLKLMEYFTILPKESFEPIILKSVFFEILAKRI